MAPSRCPGCGDPTPRGWLFRAFGQWLCAGCVFTLLAELLDLRDSASAARQAGQVAS